MKIKKRIISAAVLTFFILAVLSAYGYVNSMVSYKYEVQDFQRPGQDEHSGLDAHLLQILRDIDNCKIWGITFTILFITAFTLRVAKPTANGRLSYT